ncbi:MAG TPA: hypothetical protein VER56_05540 [Candidatus Eisenbacteria bacterium]|nr:hypothetical protein [Candidatus Eisenbacteria bacterium]
MKSDRLFRRHWCFQLLPNSCENSLKSRVVALLHRVYFSAQLLVGCQHLAKPHEGPHDRYVHLHGARSAARSTALQCLVP